MNLSDDQKRTARALAGKRITRVALHPFDAGESSGCTACGKPATDPVIHFDDGTCLRFTVDETETGEYGVTLIYPGRDK